MCGVIIIYVYVCALCVDFSYAGGGVTFNYFFAFDSYHVV